MPRVPEARGIVRYGVRYGLIGAAIGFLFAFTPLKPLPRFFGTTLIADLEARAVADFGHLGYLVGALAGFAYPMLCGAIIGGLFGVWRADRLDRKLKGIRKSS
jgi:hypothetical protein